MCLTLAGDAKQCEVPRKRNKQIRKQKKKSSTSIRIIIDLLIQCGSIHNLYSLKRIQRRWIKQLPQDRKEGVVCPICQAFQGQENLSRFHVKQATCEHDSFQMGQTNIKCIRWICRSFQEHIAPELFPSSRNIIICQSTKPFLAKDLAIQSEMGFEKHLLWERSKIVI